MQYKVEASDSNTVLINEAHSQVTAMREFDNMLVFLWVANRCAVESIAADPEVFRPRG